jgi:hypothetical protein
MHDEMFILLIAMSKDDEEMRSEMRCDELF